MVGIDFATASRGHQGSCYLHLFDSHALRRYKPSILDSKCAIPHTLGSMQSTAHHRA